MPSFESTLASRTEPLSVVIADDVVEIQELLQQWLTELGCTVKCVSTGRDAVRLLRTQRVDIVITDIIMPEGDGLEVISELKRAQGSTRILAMSGGGNHLGAADCLKFAKSLGAHGVLMKPFNRHQVLDALAQVMSVSTAPAKHPAK
jgi:CheY-like chemotaxis protein